NDFVDRFLSLIYHVIGYTAHLRSVRVTPEDTEDIAAEVLLKLVADDCRTLRAFRGNSSLATYLVVVARRICVKELARRQGVKDAIRRGESRLPEVEPDDAPAAVKGIERLEEVDRLLKRLSGREREIVRLYYLEGRTYEEISTETDVPVNTIGAVLSRARKKLRELAKTTTTEVPTLPTRTRRPGKTPPPAQ
ncbi:MAG: sigma-70 family RNA polymerase sigma factor, partial [Gemmataceae bacterium]|nr:sigma-70 family RNA polymerase sigma factor [Gemmataceae bacterium]